MKKSTLKSGDVVYYLDKDSIRWGPWTVLSTRKDAAVLQVGDGIEISYPISHRILKKANLADVPQAMSGQGRGA